MSRIDVLRELLAQMPDDAFTRYALAMELRRAGQPGEAMEEFRALIETCPDYTASYLMAAQLAMDLGLRDEALRIYRQGVSACARAGEEHARQKCEEALALLQR
jgi:tetratricopeptide (TPR) repeat protein